MKTSNWILVIATIAWTANAHAEDRVIKLTPKIRARCVSILQSGLKGDDFWPAIHAAEGLTLGGHGKEVIEFLAPKLKTVKDDQKRCGIARELVRAGDKSKAQVMQSILAGDKPHGHIHAAESLYKVTKKSDSPAMRKAFQQSKNFKLQVMAAAALAKGGNKKAMSYLRKTLKSSDPEKIMLAAWVIGRIGDKTDIDRLRSALPHCTDQLKRAYVEHSLAALGDADGLKALKRNLSSDDPTIRTYAATFAGDARAIGLVKQLEKMLDDPHPDARFRAAQSLLVLSIKK